MQYKIENSGDCIHCGKSFMLIFQDTNRKYGTLDIACKKCGGSGMEIENVPNPELAKSNDMLILGYQVEKVVVKKVVFEQGRFFE